jgi:NAD(P)H-dependent FMN reductase
MMNIVILSSSVRQANLSRRVARFLQRYITQKQVANAEIVDLQEFRFEIFETVLKEQSDAEPEVIRFANKINGADALIIICPEYNGSYPASLKNVIDLLSEQWYRKPVGLVSVSSGSFGGMQGVAALQFVLWKVHALVSSTVFPVAKVQATFDEDGVPTDLTSSERRANKFLNELVWYVEANRRMKPEPKLVDPVH